MTAVGRVCCREWAEAAPAVLAHTRSTSESFVAPGGINTLSGSLGLGGVRVSWTPDPCSILLAGPRLRLAAGREGVPVLLSGAVPHDHDSLQDLSVLAILSLRLCLGPTVG